MNSYEAKQEARRERYEERAEKARKEGERRVNAAMQGLPPMGEPIKVGHHSEKRHRRALERSDQNMRKASESYSKAEYYESKAAGVGRGGISSDDPDAIDKLREQLAEREKKQAFMKAANKAVRAAWKHGVRHDGLSEDIAILIDAIEKATGEKVPEATARAMIEPDCFNSIGFASFQLSNNNAQIKRIRNRIAQLEKAAEAERVEHDIKGVRIVENVEENRLQMFFPGKPDTDTRTLLKRYGFRWSRYHGAWQRHLNNAARFAANQVLAKI